MRIRKKENEKREQSEGYTIKNEDDRRLENNIQIYVN